MEEPSKRWIAWVHDLAVCNPHYEHDWHRPPWNVLSQACSGFEYVAVSEFRARQFEALTGRHASVIPNGIDPAELLGLTPAVAKLAADYQLHQRELVLLHPTRLLKRKNVEFGLEVLAELRRNGTDAVLLITAAGDPHNTASVDYGNWLRTRRNELSLDDSALFVSDEFQPAVADITSLFSIAVALFFPSTQEGFGLPVLEASLHRLPIFCADTEPTRTLLDHSIHLFDAHGSPSAAAALIQTTVQQSAPYRARRQAMRQYSWEVIWDKHLAPLLRVRR